MASEINFKELWSRQNDPAPDSSEIIAKANQYRKGHLYKLIRTNVLLVATCIFIGWIIFHYQPQMMTTKIGSLIVIAAMVLFMVVYNQMLPLLLKVNNNTSVDEYLQRVIKLKAKQQFLLTTMTNLYFIMLSTGLCLYMIEPMAGASVTYRILMYGLSFGWIVFSWFYFRRRAIKKHERTSNELIEKLQAIEKQLKMSQ